MRETNGAHGEPGSPNNSGYYRRERDVFLPAKATAERLLPRSLNSSHSNFEISSLFSPFPECFSRLKVEQISNERGTAELWHAFLPSGTVVRLRIGSEMTLILHTKPTVSTAQWPAIMVGLAAFQTLFVAFPK